MEIRIQIAAGLDDVALICFGLTSKSNYEIVEATQKGRMKSLRAPKRYEFSDCCLDCCEMKQHDELAELLRTWMSGKCIWCGQDEQHIQFRCLALGRALCIHHECGRNSNARGLSDFAVSDTKLIEERTEFFARRFGFGPFPPAGGHEYEASEAKALENEVPEKSNVGQRLWSNMKRWMLCCA